jgi:hypothetical protein
MIPPGSRGEPLAQDGVREAARKCRRVGESAETSQAETTDSRIAPEEEEPVSPKESPGFSCGAEDVICRDMADRFKRIMARYAANGPNDASQGIPQKNPIKT